VSNPKGSIASRVGWLALVERGLAFVCYLEFSRLRRLRTNDDAACDGILLRAMLDSSQGRSSALPRKSKMLIFLTAFGGNVYFRDDRQVRFC
jgi:hypothetical protein